MTWGAIETAKLYFQEIFKHHGLSDRIVSDRDTRFTSKFWQELCRLLGTKMAMSTSFHPQTNAANERSHKVIEEMLRCITQLPPTDWDDKLPLVEFAINDAVHSRTGYTPFALDCGQHPANPTTLLTYPYNPSFAGTQTSVTQLLKEQTEALRKARATYLRAVQRDVVKYNKNRIVPEWLKPDQQV